MTRQALFHKWFLYALALFPVWLLDACILSRYPLFGVRPMLLPLAVVAVAVLEGSHAGAGFGLGVGLLWALAYSSGKGMMVIGLTLVGLLTGAAAQYALSQSFLGCLLCSAGAHRRAAVRAQRRLDLHAAGGRAGNFVVPGLDPPGLSDFPRGLPPRGRVAAGIEGGRL